MYTKKLRAHEKEQNGVTFWFSSDDRIFLRLEFAAWWEFICFAFRLDLLFSFQYINTHYVWIFYSVFNTSTNTTSPNNLWAMWAHTVLKSLALSSDSNKTNLKHCVKSVFKTHAIRGTYPLVWVSYYCLSILMCECNVGLLHMHKIIVIIGHIILRKDMKLAIISNKH